MKNNQQFNEILNECLERMLKGDTLEQCLNKYPEQATELEPLLRTALAARVIASIQPRPEFKAKARLQLRAALNQKFCQPQPRRVRWFFVWQSAWATAVCSVLIVALIASGTVMAAGNSMPDQLLYPVKMATEKIQEAATTSSLSKAELHAALAEKRVAEIVHLANNNDAEKVEITARRLNAHLTTIAKLVGVKKILIPGAGASRVMDTARGETTAVAVTSEPAPEPAISAAPRPTKTAVPSPASPPKTAVQTRTAPAIVPGTAANDKPKVPLTVDREKLKRVVERCAVNQPARLNEALKKAPVSVRPALRKALEESVAAYTKAIKEIEAGEAD